MPPFEVIEKLAKKHGIALKTFRHQAQFGKGTINGFSVVLAKPLTFMNLSGRAVASLSKLNGLKPEQILVITDDLDMEVGRLRMRPKGSAGGHNGHKSIIYALGTDEYPRVKIGIGKGENGVEHVLGTFNPSERKLIEEAVQKCMSAVEDWLELGPERAMSRVNTS